MAHRTQIDIVCTSRPHPWCVAVSVCASSGRSVWSATLSLVGLCAVGRSWHAGQDPFGSEFGMELVPLVVVVAVE